MAENPFAQYAVPGTPAADDNPFARFAAPQLAESTDTPKDPRTGTVPAFLEGAAQGATFGFSDEIEAAARAAYDNLVSGEPMGSSYTKRLQASRERQTKASEDNPVAYYGGEIAGGVALPLGGTRLGLRGAQVAAERAILPRLMRSAKTGAGYGALYGAGKSEGDALDIAKGTAGGALVGGALGAALPPLYDLGAGLARTAIRPIQAMIQPQRVGNQKVAEAFLRDRWPSADTPKTKLGVAGEVERQLGRAQADKPDMMLADLGGENLRNLLRSAANMPSTGAQRLKNTLDKRQAHQWARIERDMAKGLADPKAFYQSVDDLAANMAQTGKTVLEPALKIETPMTDALRSVLMRPTAKELHTLAARRLADEGREIGLVNRTEMLHRMKMELDDQIGVAKRAEKMGNKPQAGWDARTLLTLKHDLLKAINNPAYKNGLKKYASEAQLKNALEDGLETALKIPTEEIKRHLATLSANEQKMWRMGAARALAGKIRQGNVTRDRTENLFSSPDMQLRLKEIFPTNRARREFQKNLVLEAKMADTRKAVQGNSTTAKQLAQAEEAGQDVRAITSVANLAAGRLEPVLAWAGRQAQRFSGLTPTSANAIIEAAMAKGGEGMSAELRKALKDAAAVPEIRAKMVQRMLAGATATATPSQTESGGLHGRTPYRRQFDDQGNPTEP